MASISKVRKKSPPISAALIVKTGSAGTLPSHVRRKKILTRSQKWIWRSGHRVVEGAGPKVLESKGSAANTAIAATKTMTPPSLWGTARSRA